MKSALIYFDGTNVMLIRESDVPQQPERDCKSGVCDGFQPDTGYCICEVRSKRYQDEIEAAKKKAIRVDDFTTDNPIRKAIVFEFDGKMYELPEGYSYEVREISPLPKVGMMVTVSETSAGNGYQSDIDSVKKHLKIGELYEIEDAEIGGWKSSAKLKGCKHWFNSVNLVQIVAIIKPIAQPESEDELWWLVKCRLQGDKARRLTWTETTAYLKSKYTITRKP